MMSYKTQEEWMKATKKQILNFRTAEFQKFYKPSVKKIGIICDEPFLQYVKPSANFVYLTLIIYFPPIGQYPILQLRELL